MELATMIRPKSEPGPLEGSSRTCATIEAEEEDEDDTEDEDRADENEEGEGRGDNETMDDRDEDTDNEDTDEEDRDEEEDDTDEELEIRDDDDMDDAATDDDDDGTAIAQLAMVITFESMVTAPLRASIRPLTCAPVLSVIDVRAKISPRKLEFVPSVAELVTSQKTLQA